MAPSRRKALSLLSTLLLATPILAKFENDFSLYPQAAQPCLYAASNSSRCDGNTVSIMNKCLCGDNKGEFVTNAALCIGKEAKDTLRIVYQTLSTACSDSKTPVPVDEKQFLDLGASGATASLSVTPSATAQSATPTTFVTTTTGGATVTVTGTNTPSPIQTEDSDESGLSTTAKIGIGVGSGIGAVALVGIIAFIWRLKRSRDAHDEARPMLDGGFGAVPSQNPSPHQGSPPNGVGAFGAFQSYEYKAEDKPAGWRPVSEISSTPTPGQQQRAWGHHPQAPYPSPPPLHAQQQPAPGVFELASIPAASPPFASHPPPGIVEMPATEVQPQAPRYQYPSQR